MISEQWIYVYVTVYDYAEFVNRNGAYDHGRSHCIQNESLDGTRVETANIVYMCDLYEYSRLISLCTS